MSQSGPVPLLMEDIVDLVSDEEVDASLPDTDTSDSDDELIDRVGDFDLTDGDLVYAKVYFMNNGWTDSIVAPMEVIKVSSTYEGQLVLEMVYTDDNTRKLYRGRYSFGDLVEISVDSEPELIDGIEYHNFRFPTTFKLDSDLVGLGKATRACICAKFEAYMDPAVAALSETPGRITRNRAYQSIV